MRIKRLYAVVIISVLSVWMGALLPLAAQSSDDWYYNKPVKLIEFEGLKNISRVDLDIIGVVVISRRRNGRIMLN